MRHPAAFINTIAESGSKKEAVEWLQKIWDKLLDTQELNKTEATQGASGFLEDMLSYFPIGVEREAARIHATRLREIYHRLDAKP